MRKYFIREYYGDMLNAGGKAVSDVSQILENIGYTPIKYLWKSGLFFQRWLYKIRFWGRLFQRMQAGDELFIQWPCNVLPIQTVVWIAYVKRGKVSVLFHDIEKLRWTTPKKDQVRAERFLIKHSDLLVAHTDVMKKFLESEGAEASKITVLSSFDYLTNGPVKIERKKSTSVTFAGNLSKSAFLDSLDRSGMQIDVLCYGRKVDREWEGICHYESFFRAEEVSELKGSWGLVWDGDSIESCTGELGNYLRYNSPHKLSLYIVAALPVIVWSGSALASYVKENNLGVVVDSLWDIPETIQSVSSEEYESFLSSLSKEALILSSGGHLQTCISKS